MTFLRTLIVLCWCLGFSVLKAQEFEPGPAPVNYVLDEANVYRADPAMLAEITESLRTLEQSCGYRIYLAIYYNILESSVQERADLLHASWVGDDKQGVVIAVQLDPAVDGRRAGISYYQTTGLGVESEAHLISDTDMIDISNKAFTAVGSNHMEGILNMIMSFRSQIDAYYAATPSQWSDTGSLKMMGVVLGVIALLGIVGVLLSRAFVKADVDSSKNYYFPEVVVAERLGAPYGGGWVSERDFSSSFEPE